MVKIFTLLALLLSVSFAKEKVLLLRGESEASEVVANSIKSNLEEYDVKIFDFYGKKQKVEILDTLIPTFSPDVIVLMDNTIIEQYIAYQKKTGCKIPSIGILSAGVSAYLPRVENFTSIDFEVSVFSAAMEVKSLFAMDIKKIGIVHTDFFANFVEQNKDFCLAENVELVSVKVEKSDVGSVKKALSQLSEAGVNALYIPNELGLLQLPIQTGAWKPFINKSKIPVIVGVPNFVGSDFGLGTIAMIPEYSAYGEMTAGMVREIISNEKNMPDYYLGVSNIPVTTKVFVNKKSALKLGATEETMVGDYEFVK